MFVEFVSWLTQCIFFACDVDVVLFCCMFRFLFLFSFACNCAGRRIIFFMVRLMIRCFVAYSFHGTVYDLMFCCLRACLLVRFLVSKYFLYVSVPVFLVCFWFEWLFVWLIDHSIDRSSHLVLFFGLFGLVPFAHVWFPMSAVSLASWLLQKSGRKWGPARRNQNSWSRAPSRKRRFCRRKGFVLGIFWPFEGWGTWNHILGTNILIDWRPRTNLSFS